MRLKPIKIVITYLVASLIWIMIGHFLVDGLSALFSMHPDQIEVLKGVFFVLFTAIVLYFAIVNQQRLLSANEKHYRSLFYANPAPLFICDVHSLSFLEVNHVAVKVYGYSLDELKRMAISDLIVNKDELGSDLPEGEWRLRKKNGSTIIARINAQKMELFEKPCILMKAEDISEEIHREETLKMLYATERELKEELEKNIVLIEHSLNEKQRLAEVIDRIHNMVVITDAEGIITWVNPAFTSVTGYTYEEAVGRHPSFLHGPDAEDNKRNEIMSEIRKRDFTTFDIINYTKSGDAYWNNVTVSAVYNDAHEVIRYISVENVITERKRIEDKLLQQNEILKKLAWTNSHAIRKPVVSILSLVELCKETFDIAEIKKFNALVEVCARELDNVTKEVGKEMNESDTI